MAEEWWEEEQKRGERLPVMSVCELLRGLREGAGLPGLDVYVFGLDLLLGRADDRAEIAKWVRSLLLEGRHQTKGHIIRMVVRKMTHEPEPKLVLSSERGREERFSLNLVFGSVSLKEDGHGYAVHTVS
jgi:hypothetical protein